MIIFLGHKITEQQVELYPEEIAHCTRILRKSVGDTIVVHVGHGEIVQGSIVQASKSQVLVHIDSSETRPQPHHLHLAVAPTKNTDRMEWLLSKATEIGVTRLTFINTQRGERKKIRFERMEKIMRSAVKQSLKSWWPQLDPSVIPLGEFLENIESNTQKYIAHYREENVQLLENITDTSPLVILIGPEGDFTQEEVAAAENHGFKTINLGTERLRTETAALYATVIAAAKLNT